MVRNSPPGASLFGELAELFDAPLFALDAGLRLVGANAAFASALRLELGQAMGKTVAELFPPPTASLLVSVAERAGKAPGSVIRETAGLAPFLSGGFSAVAIAENPGAPFTVYFHIRSEPSLGKTGELLSFADYMNDVVYMTDETGSLTYVNRQLEQKTGYRLDDLPDRVARSLIHEEDRKEFNDILAKALKGRFGTKKGLRVYHKDGRLLRLSISYGPITAADGTFRGIIGFAQDITREYNLEMRLQRSRNLEMLRSLAETIARDFHNILTSILSQISLVRMQSGKDSPFWKHIIQCEESAHRADELTQQLLACTRSGVGQPKPLDMNETIREAVAQIKASFGESFVVIFQPGGDLGRVYADPSYIKLMLNNLLYNSFEAMPTGGSVEIRTEKTVVGPQEISDIPPGEYVRVCIEDDGIGIEEKDIGRVFEPFFSTKSLRRGLGLTAVHGIVTNLNGRIGIASRYGEGATVTIHIPVMSALSLPAFGISRSENAPRVLVFDSEEPLREFCAAVFRSLGCEVSPASTVEEALEILENQHLPFDLIILNADSPVPSIEEAVRRVRYFEEEALVALFVSDQGRWRELEEGVIFDAKTKTLMKPYSYQVLSGLLGEQAAFAAREE